MVLRHTVVAALAVAGIVTSTATSAEAAPAPHGCTVPVIGAICPPQTTVLDGNQLLRTKFAALVGERTAKTALNNLLTQAKTDLKTGPWSVTTKKQVPPSGDKHDYLSLAPYWWPTTEPTAENPWGCPFVQKDGQRNPIVDEITDHAYRGEAFTAIYRLALAWYYTGDARYAQRAALDLRTWFLDAATKMNPNMNYAQGIPCKVDGRGIGIIEFSYTLTEVVDATAILATGAPGWTKTDQAGMTGWYTQFLDWLRTSKNGTDEAKAQNNHGSFYDMMAASLALGTGQRDLAKKIAQDAGPNRIAPQINADGYQPQEASRTRSWHYSNFNLVALTRLAQIGKHVGVDLWHYTAPSGASLFKAVDFLIPGATQGQWSYPELDFRQYAALDVLHAAADAGDKAARKALPLVPVEPGGDLYPVRPAAEQLDDISTS
ncbi:alginate lyase family protein [Amycolatopsis sp. OK19-0408]|uniref:Alginate lyase family protein n=1 Tax=Amycolatopsis iheyensis TaxID=2945988 RepID=A0A9X2ND38_9PSEU|nr:alginate lyase family protein [Amycolatopsis iheyensis]MCR6485562.1 alginate lyase family protein [Amycolatopsis iheyensis]